MANHYAREIQLFGETLELAQKQSVEIMSEFVDSAFRSNILAVGSGGSLTAAEFTVPLQQQNGGISKAVTPLEFLSTERVLLSQSSVIFFSASGRNHDILRAFEHAYRNNAKRLLVVSATLDSPLVHLAQETSSGFQQFELPSKKDGFLATNSLLMFVVLLMRAYGKYDATQFHDLDSITSTSHAELESYHEEILKRQTWATLYGFWGAPVAKDLESKLTEAALLNVQLADFRNFAHGRHHWFAKRGDQSGVFVLTTAEDQQLADRTVNLIPDNIPVIRLSSAASGPTGALDLLLQTMRFVNFVGDILSIDPGKPGVPLFGRRLYNLKSAPRKRMSRAKLLDNIDLAIARKVGVSHITDLEEDEHAYWLSMCKSFIEGLTSVNYGAIVLDYDGTLCNSDDRYGNLPTEIGEELQRIMDSGVLIGVATGRGKSVRSVLRKFFHRKYWTQLLIGYYNGADIAGLDIEERPDRSISIDPQLLQLTKLFEVYKLIYKFAEIDIRPKQISLQARNPKYTRDIGETLFDLLSRSELQDLQLVKSSHSWDVLAKDVSKLALVTSCQELLRSYGASSPVICIGDKGEWPGNDHQLLSTRFSLSVDSVSRDPFSCWNFSSPGLRGTQATLDYLRALRQVGSHLILEMDGL